MKELGLTEKERKTLFGLVANPDMTDLQLAELLNLKHSTVTSIRHRLTKEGYLRTIRVPLLQNLGCEMLVVIYTNFSPLIPLEERVKITGNAIEVFDEIFYSVGEEDKGFSLSLANDYTSIGKINDIRTQTFGKMGLIEDEYPHLVVFPFDISKIYRFFDHAPILRAHLGIGEFPLVEKGLKRAELIHLNDKEKDLFFHLINNPDETDSQLGERLNMSRHTISRIRRGMDERNLFRTINIPDLKKLGFEILSFNHIWFDPRKPPDIEKDKTKNMMGDFTLFMASRAFEAVLINVYQTYDDYKAERNRMMQVLKENNWIAENPHTRSYSLNTMRVIKDFKFAPIAAKVTKKQ